MKEKLFFLISIISKTTKKKLGIIIERFKYFTFFACILFLISCSTPRNPESWMEMEKNACLPTAIAFKEGLKKYDIWSEVVTYNYFDPKKNKLSGHAITAYMYPKGKNQLWTYDYMGSYRTRAFKNNPYQIAQQAEILRGRNNIINHSEFLK
jgi:hypothetical protein